MLFGQWSPPPESLEQLHFIRGLKFICPTGILDPMRGPNLCEQEISEVLHFKAVPGVFPPALSFQTFQIA